ncbi:cytochrome P450 [Thraustotheca clavata]|uniref:Cytochrome P450 n=1 Tax=Thraustotheca clavata TaxID=74557 RepID=A0A1V9YXY8_9STRA|nr:cytochrome P450 [Thraustotheca clavata]
MLKQFKVVSLRHLPGPPTELFIGNLRQVAQNFGQLCDWKLQLANTYGSTYCFRVDMISDGLIFTSNPENVEHVLKTNQANYVKPSMMDDVLRTEFLGADLFAINNDETSWVIQGKLIESLTSPRALKVWTEEVFAPHLDNLCTTLNANVRKIVDLEPLVLHWTSNCVCEMTFGSTMDKATMATLHSLMKKAGEIMMYRFTHPWLKWMKWCSPSQDQLDEITRQINEITCKTINNHREAIKTKNISSKYVLSELLCQQYTLYKKSPITDNLVQDVMMAMLLHVRESVGSCVLWVIYCIAEDPRVDFKLHNMLRRLGNISYDSIKYLRYLDAVILETLRLFPPTPSTFKLALDNDMLPDGTCILAGSLIEYSPYVMGRDETQWENADEYFPERWLHVERLPSSFEFPVFSAGKQSYVEKYMVMAQIKIIIATLFRNYRFEVVTHDPTTESPIYSPGLTLFPQNGMHVVPYLRD